MASPTRPLFSGWNWQPATLPRPIAAVPGAEYYVTARVSASQRVPWKECTKYT